MTITFDKLEIQQEGFSLQADLEIGSGEKIAIIGPSGGGKTTLLMCIAGFAKTHSGRLLVGRKDITDLPPAARPVTLLFQDHNLFPHLSVRQNIGLGVKPDLRLSLADKQSVSRVIGEIGLADHADKLPGQLSGGQQQRVALARALLRDKPLLLLDEPFAALGPALKREMLELVTKITETSGATLLLVTHQPDDALFLGGKTILVAEGKAAAPVDTQKLFADPPAALKGYLG